MKPFLLLIIVFSVIPAVAATAASEALSTTPHQKNLHSVRKEIDALTRDIAQKEAIRKETQTAIRQSEQAIKHTNDALHSLEQRQESFHQQLAELKHRVHQTRRKVTMTRQRVIDMLSRQYKKGRHDAMKLMLNASDPNQTSRDLVYYQYIARSQQQLIKELKSREHDLETALAKLDEELARLNQLIDRKAQEKSQLIEGKTHKEHAITQIAGAIHQRQTQLEKLKDNEKRLSHLITQINRELVRQKNKQAALRKARQEAAAKSEKERRRQWANTAHKQGKPLPPAVHEPSTQANREESDSTEVKFDAQTRLFTLPVAGDMVGKFGAARSEGTTWKGIFVRTPVGQPIHTLAPGRVVYSDFLRGFGNAVIVDHGSHYLTVYTGLTTISRSLGSTVAAGDVLGTSGQLENGETGLYFELRHFGKPINPMTWIRR